MEVGQSCCVSLMEVLWKPGWRCLRCWVDGCRSWVELLWNLAGGVVEVKWRCFGCCLEVLWKLSGGFVEFGWLCC